MKKMGLGLGLARKVEIKGRRGTDKLFILQGRTFILFHIKHNRIQEKKNK